METLARVVSGEPGSKPCGSGGRPPGSVRASIKARSGPPRLVLLVVVIKIAFVIMCRSVEVRTHWLRRKGTVGNIYDGTYYAFDIVHILTFNSTSEELCRCRKHDDSRATLVWRLAFCYQCTCIYKNNTAKIMQAWHDLLLISYKFVKGFWR